MRFIETVFRFDDGEKKLVRNPGALSGRATSARRAPIILSGRSLPRNLGQRQRLKENAKKLKTLKS
jgi:hypothetical protein